MAAGRRWGAKARIVASLPNLSEVEIGELIYVSGTNRLYIRLISGWVFIAPDG